MLLYLTRLSIIAAFFINTTGCFNAEKTSFGEGKKSTDFAIKGVSMVAPVKPIDSSALAPIKNIHANSIAIMPYAFCTPENPIIQYNHKGQWWGESDDGVVGCIQLAHKQNLSVMLKPHLWIAHGMYTGAFALKTENEWKVWEDSYREYIMHFAILADSLKTEVLCFGTELGATVKERPQFWRSLIDSLKQVFHGKLTYAANWDDYKSFPFWDKLDYIGVDAYFPLATDKTPGVTSYIKGWNKYAKELENLSNKVDRQILFSEYGYRNVDFNGAEPWKENDGSQNDDAQANAYQAFYETFAGKKWFAGGYVWKWYADESRHHRPSIDYTPQNRPAEKVIQNWYRN